MRPILAGSAFEFESPDVDFECYETKSDRRFASDGFGFDYAALIFEGPTQWPDLRRDYGETRMIALGDVDGHILVVVYTDRIDARRIISARPAGRKERQKWQLFVEA